MEIIIVTVLKTMKVFNALKAGASGYITKSAKLSGTHSGSRRNFTWSGPMSSKIAKMVTHSSDLIQTLL